MHGKPQFAGERVRLGDIANVTTGNVAPKASDFSEEGIPFVRAGSLSGLIKNGDYDMLDKVDKPTAKQLKLKLFPAGTVLFAKSGMSCLKGYVYTLERPCYVVSHLACVTPKGSMSTFLQHYFKYNKPNRLIENPSFPSIKLSKISEIEIAIPNEETLSAQTAVLNKINQQIAITQEQTSRLDTLVKSRFIEMFGDPIALNSNKKSRLDSFAKIITGNTPSRKKPEYYGDYIEWIKTDNITSTPVLTKAAESLSEDGASAGRIAPSGSVLMSCIAGSVKSIGKVAIADRPVAFNQQINAIIPADGILTEYLYWMLSLSKDYLCSDINMQLKGILNKTALSRKMFCVPPPSLQQEFATFVRQVDKLRFESGQDRCFQSPA